MPTASGDAYPKSGGRIKDPQVLATMHITWRECALCHATGVLSLHHVSKHPRNDVEGNLVMLCGSGTTGCHGLIEAHDHDKLRELGAYILKQRPDTIVYLYDQLGPVSAQEWMRRHFLIPDRVSLPS